MLGSLAEGCLCAFAHWLASTGAEVCMFACVLSHTCLYACTHEHVYQKAGVNFVWLWGRLFGEGQSLWISLSHPCSEFCLHAANGTRSCQDHPGLTLRKESEMAPLVVSGLLPEKIGGGGQRSLRPSFSSPFQIPCIGTRTELFLSAQTYTSLRTQTAWRARFWTIRTTLDTTATPKSWLVSF